jgi:hypothetical protein
MGADKNSPRRSNSAHVPNSQPRIPTRVCQGRVVTTDLPTLGTNPKYSQCKRETQEAKDLNDLHSLGQTVRVEAADCPRGPGGLSASTGRTVRKCHLNFQYCTSKNGVSVEHSRTPRADCLTNSSQQKTTNETDRNTDTQEHAKNTTNTRSASSSWTVRDSLADGQPRADRAA